MTRWGNVFWRHNLSREPHVRVWHHVWRADKVFVSVHAMWESGLFTPPSIAWDLKVANRRKTTTWTRGKSCQNHFLFGEVPLISTLKFLLFSLGWRSPIIPTLIRLQFIVLLPLWGWGVLLVTFTLLLRMLPSLLRWMDWLVSLSGNMFFV